MSSAWLLAPERVNGHADAVVGTKGRRSGPHSTQFTAEEYYRAAIERLLLPKLFHDTGKSHALCDGLQAGSPLPPAGVDRMASVTARPSGMARGEDIRPQRARAGASHAAEESSSAGRRISLVPEEVVAPLHRSLPSRNRASCLGRRERAGGGRLRGDPADLAITTDSCGLLEIGLERGPAWPDGSRRLDPGSESEDGSVRGFYLARRALEGRAWWRRPSCSSWSSSTSDGGHRQAPGGRTPALLRDFVRAMPWPWRDSYLLVARCRAWP